eukprot:SM000083S22739  [mRNA]  locus=s83:230146:240228:+ [translate_table: standard]
MGAGLPVLERYQPEAFLRAVAKAAPAGGGGGRRADSDWGYSVEDMLSFQQEPIPTSLLRLPGDLVPAALKAFAVILRWQGVDGAGPPPSAPADRAALVQRLYRAALRRPELRDEVYAQIIKQSRGCPDREARLAVWQLAHLCAAAMPPGKDVAAYLADYIHGLVGGGNGKPAAAGALTEDAAVVETAARAFRALKRSVRVGPRQAVPSAAEVEALLGSRRPPAVVVHFLDNAFEEVAYDMTTTVAEATEAVAGAIKLVSFQTFGLFEARSAGGRAAALQEATMADEHLGLDENRYLGDVVASSSGYGGGAGSAGGGDGGTGPPLRLVFKKKLFREADEGVAEPIFAQHEYLAGNYPVGRRDDAAQLAALQILADQGPDAATTSSGAEVSWAQLVQAAIPAPVFTTRPRAEWEQDVLSRLRLLVRSNSGDIHRPPGCIEALQQKQGSTKDDARGQLLRFLRALPYGSSVFYHVRRVEDPIGLLPGKLILGINKRGIHFFRPIPKEYLHSAELRDIMQFGSSSSAVFFKMRVAGVLHVFQFETKQALISGVQGEDVCLALQSHINDVLLRKLSRKVSAGATAAGSPSQLAPSIGREEEPRATAAGGADAYDLGMVDMARQLEQAKRRNEQLSSEVAEWQERERKLLEDVASLEDRLCAEESTRAGPARAEEYGSTREALAQVIANGVAQAKDNVEAGGAALTAKSPVKGALDGPAAVMAMAGLAPKATDRDSATQIRQLQAQLKDLRAELKTRLEAATKAEDVFRKLQKEKQLLEQKYTRLQNSQKGEKREVEQRWSEERRELEARTKDAERLSAQTALQLAEATRQLDERNHQLSHMDDFFKELEGLREEKEDWNRKEAASAEVIRKQGEQIAELELLYKEEQLLRRRYFNMMEDMKGKIRVYARTRPLSEKEDADKERSVIMFPDELTLEYVWKDGEKPKQHNFDRVFPGNASQEQVFEDTKYLVQSAIDGYNICIFAYGQTGSGKTYTIYGTPENPGLTPRAMHELYHCLERDGSKYAYELKVYMLELYQDNLQDLLLPKNAKKLKLEIRKDAKGMVVVENATLLPVKTLAELEAIVGKGMAMRVTAGTNMNAESSRSHLIMSIVIESTNLQSQAVTRGKLSLVDLAGSERIKKSGSTGEQLKEAQSINKSLSALGDVISALATGQEHVPYRNHKLTMLMSDSLGGNAKTLMFVNVSPVGSSLDETNNSLSYAVRVRSITNQATKDVQTQEILRLRRRIAYLKEVAGKKAEDDELEDVDDLRPQYTFSIRRRLLAAVASAGAVSLSTPRDEYLLSLQLLPTVMKLETPP